MSRHYRLAIKRFLTAVPFDLLQRYFTALDVEPRPPDWLFFSTEGIEDFLQQEENADAATVILEDFQRINDLCCHSVSLLVRSARNVWGEVDAAIASEELGMRLFLNAREAFEEAWSWHLFYATGSKATVLAVPGLALSFGTDEVTAFSADLKDWFSGLAKGTECHLRHFAGAQEHVFLITRGSYLRTVAQWRGSEIAFHTFRPASEDVVVYNPQAGELTIRAALPKDRQQYVAAFARCLAGDVTLAQRMLAEPALTLAPLQTGRFDFSGDGEITAVWLVSAVIELPLAGNPVVTVRADNVVETLHYHLKCLAFSGGTLRAIKLRFRLECAGEPETLVTVEIEPPDRTNLAQKKHADVIERFLVEQGVKRG